MTSMQFTAPRTVAAKSGMILPTTINQQTDFNLMEVACHVFSRYNGYRVAYDTLALVKDAMRDSSAVVVLYIGADGGQDARVLWPNSITLTKENNITCKAYCTLRGQWKSFRIDRMLTIHPLTTPDDVLTDYEGSVDFEDSPAGAAFR